MSRGSDHRCVEVRRKRLVPAAESVRQAVTVGDLSSQAVVDFANRNVGSGGLLETPRMAFADRPNADNKDFHFGTHRYKSSLFIKSDGSRALRRGIELIQRLHDLLGIGEIFQQQIGSRVG